MEAQDQENRQIMSEQSSNVSAPVMTSREEQHHEVQSEVFYNNFLV